MSGQAIENLRLSRADTAVEDLRVFAFDWLRAHLRDKGHGREAVAAVAVGGREGNPVQITSRVDALERVWNQTRRRTSRRPTVDAAASLPARTASAWTASATLPCRSRTRRRRSLKPSPSSTAWRAMRWKRTNTRMLFRCLPNCGRRRTTSSTVSR